jgi:hypothetical protein
LCAERLDLGRKPTPNTESAMKKFLANTIKSGRSSRPMHWEA